MSEKKCPQCRNSLTDMAAYCPRCGYGIPGLLKSSGPTMTSPQPRPGIGVILFGAFVFLGLGLLAGVVLVHEPGADTSTISIRDNKGQEITDPALRSQIEAGIRAKTAGGP